MISQILDYTKKYYPYSPESGTFDIVTDGIVGTFSETYFVGQYINIEDSFLNDGTYKITDVSTSKLTLDATLQEEDGLLLVWGLKLPTGLLNLISDIETYVNTQTTKADIVSESQGYRSVTYASGSTWQKAFLIQLNQYRNIYDDRIAYRRRYNIVTKR